MLMLGMGTSRVSIIFNTDFIFSWISEITIILEVPLLLCFETSGVNGWTLPLGVKTAPSVLIKSAELIL